MEIKGAVDDVDAQDAERLLLSQVVFIQQPYVDDDFRGSGSGLHQAPHPKPAITGTSPRIAAGGNGVGKDEELGALSPLVSQALFDQPVLVIQHGYQPASTDVTIGGPVNRIAEGHVIGADGLGNRPRGSPDLEEPACYFLPGADLGKGSVLVAIEVDAKCFLVGVQALALLFHGRLLRN